MYDPILATFEADQIYNQNDAAGFISLFSLPIRVRALLEKKNG
jgi:argininosuccinate synthase